MNEVVSKLWGYCNTLRHDGINYGDYIEQLTYLLFLKLADEREVNIPESCSWNELKSQPIERLTKHYANSLSLLGQQEGILGDIFAGALSKFHQPVNLRKLISLIDETEWSSFDIDLKANVYEGLLQKYAIEQKGAGQYFTPREAIRCIVRCIKPDFREKNNFLIHDPACGTAGFLIGAYEWIMLQTNDGMDLSLEDKDRLQNGTFSGIEIVQETRRLALMNLYLHNILDGVDHGDALLDGPHVSKRYDCIMTNPPFGNKGAGEWPLREDFKIKTANKQLNFILHLLTILKPGGRAAIVLPDNALFEDHAAKEVRKLILSECNVHTILMLPIGTFAPYAAGVKANIVFFEKGTPTRELWIYDLRTSVESITRSNPLTDAHFQDFEICYNKQPRQETDRFKKFTISIIRERDYNLANLWDIEASVKPIKVSPENLILEAISNLETALNALNEIALKLES